MVGIAMAALFGFTVWPIFAIISLSRQDFVAAIESYIRMIPPPIGDMLANTFLEGNRAVARIDEKRIKLGNDIANALNQISQLSDSVSSSMKQGFESLAKQTQEAAAKASDMMNKARSSIPTPPPMPTMPTAPPMPTIPTIPTQYQQATIPVASPPTTGGFHRRTRRKTWRTKTRTTRVLTTRRISARR
jgi:hypothetical protein